MALATTIYPGTPANGLYLVIQQLADGKAWDTAAEAFETFDAGSIGDYDIALSQLGGDLWGATIPADITAGNYYFTFYEQQGASPATTDPALPSSYFGYWNGTEVTSGAASYTGRYTSDLRIQRWMGEINADTYSNVEGGSTADIDAYTEAIDWVEDEIDAYFGGSMYAIPFTATGASLPGQIGRWATKLAGCELYEKRGKHDDGDKMAGKFAGVREDVYKEMSLYVGGIRQLSGVSFRTGATGNAVTIVETDIGPISAGANLIPSYQSRYFGRRYRGNGQV